MEKAVKNFGEKKKFPKEAVRKVVRYVQLENNSMISNTRKSSSLFINCYYYCKNGNEKKRLILFNGTL